jgi:ubiquinone/menaquinone biosynthesis C-methylase UbiE
LNEVELQRAYYAETAGKYDGMHAPEPLALAFLDTAIELLAAASVLEIGAGTGKVTEHLMQRHPTAKITGIEPVGALRDIASKRGVNLLDGDVTRMTFADASFDLVCCNSVLHHVRHPEVAVAEMLRVARLGIFICDDNNFAQGRWWVRSVKQAAHLLGLWPVVNFVKTRGRGYMVTEGDGVAYSYSVFTNYAQVQTGCRAVHLLNLADASPNLYRSAAKLALLGIK